jgi:hypothetical protein
MTEAWRSFAFYDRRTGKRAGMASYPSAEACERELAYWHERDARGIRPDLHDTLPHLDYIDTTEHAWGSEPGDVIGRPVICSETLSDWIDWSPTVFTPLQDPGMDYWRRTT